MGPLVLSRRPARRTWWGCSRTPTCAPSTPSVSPSCPRTSSWQGGSVANVHKEGAVSDLLPRYTLWTFSDRTTVFSKILKYLCFDFSLHPQQPLYTHDQKRDIVKVLLTASPSMLPLSTKDIISKKSTNKTDKPLNLRIHF